MPLLSHMAGDAAPSEETPVLFPLLRSLNWTQSYAETPDREIILTRDMIMAPLRPHSPRLSEVKVRTYQWFRETHQHQKFVQG